MDGTDMTALRTAGAAAVLARLLAREDARVLTIIGAGVQGRTHLELFPLVRDIEEIRVSSLRLVGGLPSAARGASGELLERGRLFVETRLAFEPTPMGCYELQGVDPATGTELSEVLNGQRRGRSSE